MYSNAPEPLELVQMSKCSWYIENHRKWSHIYKTDNWYVVETYISYPIPTKPIQSLHSDFEEAVEKAIMAIQ